MNRCIYNHSIISVLPRGQDFSSYWGIDYLEVTKAHLYFLGKYQHPMKSANCHKMLACSSLRPGYCPLSTEMQVLRVGITDGLTEGLAYFSASQNWHIIQLKEAAWLRRKNIWTFQKQHYTITWPSCLSFFICNMGLPLPLVGQGWYQIHQCLRLAPNRPSLPHTPTLVSGDPTTTKSLHPLA